MGTRLQAIKAIGTIAGIYVCPVILIASGLVPFEWRFYVLIVMTLLAVGLALSRHSIISLGLGLPKFWSFMGWSVLPSAILIGAIFLADLPHRRITPDHMAFYIFFVFVSAPAQEFLYRSFLFAELAKLQVTPRATVLLSTALFGFMHVIYKDLATVLLTLTVGFIWAIVFHTTRRVSIVAVSHAALGVVAILSGVI